MKKHTAPIQITGQTPVRSQSEVLAALLETPRDDSNSEIRATINEIYDSIIETGSGGYAVSVLRGGHTGWRPVRCAKSRGHGHVSVTTSDGLNFGHCGHWANRRPQAVIGSSAVVGPSERQLITLQLSA